LLSVSTIHDREAGPSLGHGGNLDRVGGIGWRRVRDRKDADDRRAGLRRRHDREDETGAILQPSSLPSRCCQSQHKSVQQAASYFNDANRARGKTARLAT
jgi:hypothetical protein